MQMKNRFGSGFSSIFCRALQQDAGVALDSQIIDVGMRCGKIHHEAALSHTDLNVKRLL